MTPREDVETLAGRMTGWAPTLYGSHWADEAAAMLRALVAERDAARAEAARLRDGITKALLEIEDAGPKALKYAAQELRAALAGEARDE